MMDAWALAAVEKEAMARARLEVLAHPEDIRICGLGCKQIIRLIQFYQEKTGLPAHAICERTDAPR